MSKLSLDALKERANAIASEELMASINGGTENSCHNGGLTGHLSVDAKIVQPAPKPNPDGPGPQK